MDQSTRNGAPHPTLEHHHPARLLPVESDIRDRNAPDYREWFDRLVADLRQRGVQVPLICYREGGRLRVLDGETRRLAALLAGLDKVPVLVYEEKPDEANLKLGQLLANTMRRDMQPLELATIYSELLRINGWTQADLARAIHVSPGQVTKVLAISGKLLPEVQAMVAAGKLPPRAAYAISHLPMPQQLELAHKAADLPMAVESVEEAVNKLLGNGRKAKPKPVKIYVDGVTLLVPGDWTWQQIRDFVAKLKGAADRGEKMDAPLSLLPNLLKSA